MFKRIHIIEIDHKPVFATSISAEFHLKKKELDEEGQKYSVNFTELSREDHSALLRECTKNMIALHNKKRESLNMVDKQ